VDAVSRWPAGFTDGPVAAARPTRRVRTVRGSDPV